jgi:hypothetical protein
LKEPVKKEGFLMDSE